MSKFTVENLEPRRLMSSMPINVPKHFPPPFAKAHEVSMPLTLSPYVQELAVGIIARMKVTGTR